MVVGEEVVEVAAALVGVGVWSAPATAVEGEVIEGATWDAIFTDTHLMVRREEEDRAGDSPVVEGVEMATITVGEVETGTEETTMTNALKIFQTDSKSSVLTTEQ